ncbi:MAG TPA: Ku protein [Longimicrobiales bacterium]|nr:Ku protein [Longimicrobiales bacterium]
MPDDELQEELRARSFWSGTLTFGLVSVPVALLPATRSVRLPLRMLSPEGVPLRREFYDAKSERRVDRDDIVRGYEVADDEYVVVTDEELESLEPKKSRDIDLRQFVDRDAIDPMYFDRAYFLAPAGDSTKAYRLLAETMERTNRAGIATFIMRDKEYLIAILAEDGILRAETLRFADEVRSPEDLGLPEPPKLKAAALRRFEQLIAKLKQPQFDPDELHDHPAERLRALIERKQRAGEDIVASGVTAEDEDAGDDVIDLMEILKRSMAGAGGGGRKAAQRAGGSRRGAKQAAGTPERSSPRTSARSRSGSRSHTSPAAADLEELTKEELYERARQHDIPGRSSMSKKQLISALRRSA